MLNITHYQRNANQNHNEVPRTEVLKLEFPINNNHHRHVVLLLFIPFDLNQFT